MIIATYNNSLKIDNGQSLNNPIGVAIRTVCDGSWTEFEITLPENAKIKRGKIKLKNDGKPYTIRVYKNR